MNRYLDFSFADGLISQHTTIQFSNEHFVSSKNLFSFYTFENHLRFPLLIDVHVFVYIMSFHLEMRD